MKPTTQIHRLTALGLSLLALGIPDCALAADTPAGASKPDIVVFLTDDQSQLDGSPYGGQGMRTPNMQRLADAGHDIHPRLCGVAQLCAKPRGACSPASCPPAMARKPITASRARS